MPASEVTCPVCKGTGATRDRTGEKDFCGVCQGSGVVVGFVCVNPEADCLSQERDDQ